MKQYTAPKPRKIVAVPWAQIAVASNVTSDLTPPRVVAEVVAAGAFYKASSAISIARNKTEGIEWSNGSNQKSEKTLN
jgi:hypothetical protein